MITYEAWFDAKQTNGTYWNDNRSFTSINDAETWLKNEIQSDNRYKNSVDRVSGINVVEN